MRESFFGYIKTVFKHWWLLVAGVIGGGLGIAPLVGITPIIPWTIGLVVFMVCLLIASFLAYSDLYAESQKKNAAVINPRRTHLTMSEQTVLFNLNNRMEDVHGHDDYRGIETDYQNCIDSNDILKRDCSICGKPRDKRGDYGY